MSGCPGRQDVPGVRIPGLSCLASGRSRQDVADRDGVVISTLDCNAKGWDIDTRRTRFSNIALESYFASYSYFFL